MAPSYKTLRGSQGLSIHRLLFLKNTDTDSPFTCVKKKIAFQYGRHMNIAKGALKLPII